MTIQLLQPYAGASPGIYTYSAAEEARLVGLGLARYYTVGMDGRNPVLSNAEEIANQAMVSADGIQTWANRGLALAAGLTRCFFTDVGIGGSYWDYLGGRWRPQARFVTLKNLTSSVTQTTNTRAVMDFCTLPAGLWQDGDIIECSWYKALPSGTDTDTTESAIGTGSGTYGVDLGLTTAALTNTNPVVSARWRWRRVSASVIRHASIGGSTGLGAASGLLSDITTGPDLDATTSYLQLSGKLTTGAGAVSSLRACTWTLFCGA